MDDNNDLSEWEERRKLLLEMCRGIVKAEEDPNIESLTEEDILEETKGMTLKPPPKSAKAPDTWEIFGCSTDISKEMKLLEKWAERQRNEENNKIHDILEKAGPMRTAKQTEFCHERCRVLCSKPEWCPFADNPFTPGNPDDRY